MTDGIAYEPTRDHWTPYEPWMLNALAPNARVSWIDTDTDSDPTECRAPWNSLDPVELARLNTLTPVGFMRWFGSLRVHPDDVPERPAEDDPDVDPDEALAVIIDDLVDVHGSTSEWADNEYITRSTALAIARAAREHIEAERGEGGYNIRRAERERRYREEAEADLADMTRQRDALGRMADHNHDVAAKVKAERDKWRAKHAALRADVEEHSGAGSLPILNEEARDILYRDDERGQS